MCGRTGLTLDKEQVRCACSYKLQGRNSFTKPEWLSEHNAGKDFTPSCNIAPTDVTPVLVSASKYKANTERVLKPMLWGIIPPWHKGDYQSHNLTTNNCRLENIKSSKLYSPILKKGGRCVIVAEGFYEWQTTNKSSRVKQPYYIYAPQSDSVQIDDPETYENIYCDKIGWKGVQLLYMAGLYHAWKDDDTVIYSYSVITMESNETFSWLHHRMPAILNTDEKINAWLDIDQVDSDTALAHLRPVTLLAWHPVSTLVNNARNKSEQCNKRIIENKPKTSQKTITAWFTKSSKRKSDTETTSTKKIKTCDASEN